MLQVIVKIQTLPILREETGDRNKERGEGRGEGDGKTEKDLP